MENDYDEIDSFVKDCAPYLGMSGGKIPKETAQALFDRFLELFE